MATEVSHSCNLFEDITIYVMCVPANATKRTAFLNNINTIFNLGQPPNNRCILLGDFNHNLYRNTRSNRNPNWHQWIQSHWHDALHADIDCRNMPTFRSISTIDFLLVTNNIRHGVSRPKVQYVPRCDHFAVSVVLTLGEQRTGPGLWHCNTFLSQDRQFQQELLSFCESAAHHIPMMDAPSQWDRFKVILKSFIQNFSHKAHTKTKRQQAYLHKQRSYLLQQPHHENNSIVLSHVELQLDHIAETSASTLALRSGLRRREKGERSNAYFYRTIQTRQQKQAIHEI